MTRTQNSFFNLVTGLGSSLLLILLNFITRTVFVRFLGTSYLGIEGLFSNILSMLSLADLGIGSAIIYKLYKPLEENDRPRILALLKLYRQVYFVIGFVIVALGLILIPFLPDLVKHYERFSELGLNPVFIFALYLLNTASSYWFFAYKTSFVQANQKSYFITVVGYILSLLSTLCQIAALAIFRSFVLYIVTQLVFTILAGIMGAVICDRHYPYVNEKTDDRISRGELREFAKDCSALLIYQVHGVVINSTDNIILSAIYGLDAVGLYSNYLVVKNSIRNILTTIIYAFKASLGSLHSVGNLDWSRLMFRVVNLLTSWLYGVGAIGLAVLLNDFIFLWLGSEEYVVSSWIYNGTAFPTPVALLVGIEMYVIGQREYFGLFRNTMGLFQQMKFRPVASIIVNLVVCIPGVYFLGPAGCVLSTIIAGLTTNMIFDPIIIYKYGLKTSVKPFFLQNLLYIAVVAAAGLLSWFVCSLIPLGGIPGFLVRGCVCVLVPSAVFTACFFKTQEFRFLWNTATDILRLRLGKSSDT